MLLGEHNIGDEEYDRVDVAEILDHPDYNSDTLDNDYAILRLANPVSVSELCLPSSRCERHLRRSAGHRHWLGYHEGRLWSPRGQTTH